MRSRRAREEAGDVPVVIVAMAIAVPSSSGSVPRVRDVGDPSISTLLQETTHCSATFRREVDRINQTDGLVYLEHGACKEGRHACLLMSITVAGPSRVLRVHLDIRRDPPTAMSQMGHELQHAIEALSERGVTSNALLYAFFERLAGAPTARGQLAFETTAALIAGDAVRDEVEECRRSTRLIYDR